MEQQKGLNGYDPQVYPAIRTERNSMLFAHTASICVISLVFSMIVALVIYNQYNATHVWLWFAAKFITVMLRLVHLQLYRLSLEPDIPAWHTSLIAVLSLDALVWGVGGYWMMFSPSLAETAAIVVTLFGASAVTTLVLQSDVLCNAAFNVPMLIPMALGLLQRADMFGVYCGLGTITFLLLMILEGRRAELRLVELVTLRCTTDQIAQQLSESLRQVQMHSAYKSQFLANMSHEMRTPLHGILSLTRIIRQKQTDTTMLQQFDLVERSGEHLLGVINDVLDLSRIEAGRIVIQAQPFDLRELLEDVTTLLEVQIRHKQLQLVREFSLPTPCRVIGDAARVQQVLHNLIGNALKFTEEGQILVRVDRDVESGHIVIAVEDSGIGIAQKDQVRIFEAFTQTESAFDRRFGGTGLGLTIARELSRAMGGDLFCQSQVGVGSCFTFRVPLPPVLNQPALATQPQQALLLHGLLAGHVLLAEDNEVNAIVAEFTLQRLGLSIDKVDSGQAAVSYMREHQPNLILMDCQMPIMDGFEATRQIRHLEKRLQRSPVPIIALTANALEGDRERCLEAGMNEHLSKPFKDEELEAIIRRYLKPAPIEAESQLALNLTVNG